ncbi:SDR family NAD(P)-dependent oxidoreductase [Epibacterium ulvae]|uniref:SDR family NAD(P)-dependent oxidoreductase n=1 Tax=Epibacterium ulvae TaxID=1156985 RepID=UPI001BFC85EB|nr:SDR family NAD(P)-dependent oxidoreductase [Epibacterium ulvae]MBT8154911.1 SDR family NAD(P)-dependent oxidoreductase [Epibacterium ulvae]
MTKTILITGSTDGIGLLTAKTLAAQGHHILLHGRSPAKLEAAVAEVGGDSEPFLADMSRMADVVDLADGVAARAAGLDVVINNAGIYETPEPRMPDGHDIRFMVNTFAPFVLTQRLMPILPQEGRVVNVSSAAQAPVDLDALAGTGTLGSFPAYAQSKLALMIWTQELAKEHPNGPVVVSVNPGSLLASKMVKDGFGVAGNDLAIGADILARAALGPSFADASGQYFDNDAGQFAPPHVAAQNPDHVAEVMDVMKRTIATLM